MDHPENRPPSFDADEFARMGRIIFRAQREAQKEQEQFDAAERLVEDVPAHRRSVAIVDWRWRLKTIASDPATWQALAVIAIAIRLWWW